MIETGDGARVTATYLHHGDRVPVLAEPAAVRGPRVASRASAITPAIGRKEGVDFTGKRVAIIGTGSSAVQSIPIIAAQAKHLTVFQRTPNYAVPAHNAPLDPEYVRAIKADYPALRARAKQTMTGIDFDYRDEAALETPPEERAREYERRWQHGGLSFLGAYKDLMVDQDGQRHGGRVRARQDPRAGARSRGRRAAGAQEHHRLQAAVRRHRLLRDVQPAERRR